MYDVRFSMYDLQSSRALRGGGWTSRMRCLLAARSSASHYLQIIHRK